MTYARAHEMRAEEVLKLATANITMTYARAREMRGLLDALRFEPVVDIGFLEEDPMFKFEERKFPALHELLERRRFDFEIVHDIFSSHENLFFHDSGVYQIFFRKAKISLDKGYLMIYNDN